MDIVSTITKGNALEKTVFDLIKETLDNGDFFLNSKRSKIFWKKKYFSVDRQDEIEFDIAIETYNKDAEQYSQLTLFECKNYKHSVPVKDIEAFSSKLDQVGKHNTKGYFITSSRFQKSALTVAKSQKMGVGVMTGKSQIDWLNHRKDKSPLGNTLPVIEDQLCEESVAMPFFGFANARSFETLPQLLIDAGVIDLYKPNEKYIKIQYRSEDDIDARISQLNIYKCYDVFKLNTERLCTIMSELYDVNFIFTESLGLSHISRILGKINYDIPEIYIDRELQSNPMRFRFTLCHEIGHLALHYDQLKPYFETTIDTEDMFSKEVISQRNNVKMEIQANMFASQILLPYFSFMNFVSNYFETHDIHKPHLLLDEQKENQILVYSLLNEIHEKFHVSKEVARIRLKNLGLLNDQTENSLNDIFRQDGLLKRHSFQ